MTPKEPKPKWVPVRDTPPPDRQPVLTRVWTGQGVQREEPLARWGRMWVHPETETYATYAPTHWRNL